MDKKVKKETTALFVRIDRQMHKELSVIAGKEYRTMSSVAKQAIAEFLKKKNGD